MLLGYLRANIWNCISFSAQVVLSRKPRGKPCTWTFGSAFWLACRPILSGNWWVVHLYQLTQVLAFGHHYSVRARGELRMAGAARVRLLTYWHQYTLQSKQSEVLAKWLWYVGLHFGCLPVYEAARWA